MNKDLGELATDLCPFWGLHIVPHGGRAMKLMTCPFCNIPEDQILAEGDGVLAIRDKYPVSEGHILIIPHRHVADYFDLTGDERTEMDRMLLRMKRRLDAEFSPHGYNVGVNVGRAAGQTIDHVHLHLIPRYEGDMDDPSGGIRGAIPDKRVYR